ncbi:MAG: HD domain-containing protein [Spirochaetaceae bacterium]|nr:MAG: HD domain-containing protein [Spirochaetaceae bacterium]
MSISNDTTRISDLLDLHLSRWLSERRLRHIKGVEQTALALARRFGVDPAPVRLASLAHDMDRETPASVQLALVSDWRIPLTPFERANPKVLHGAVSAERLVREYGVRDTAVYDAVRHHTLGDPVLAEQEIPVGLILYVADYCEPGRVTVDQETRLTILNLPEIPLMVLRILESVRNVYGPLEEPTERLYASLVRERDDAT